MEKDVIYLQNLLDTENYSELENELNEINLSEYWKKYFKLEVYYQKNYENFQESEIIKLLTLVGKPHEKLSSAIFQYKIYQIKEKEKAQKILEDLKKQICPEEKSDLFLYYEIEAELFILQSQYDNNRDFDKLLKEFLTKEKYFQKTKRNQILAEYHLSIAGLCQVEFQHDQGIKYAKQAIDYFENQDQKKNLIRAMDRLSILYLYQGNLKEAETINCKVFRMCQEYQFTTLLANSLVTSSYIQQLLGNINESIKCLVDAEGIIQDNNITNPYTNFALLYHKIRTSYLKGNFQKSIDLTLNSIKNNNNISPVLPYYLGLNYLELNEITKITEVLELFEDLPPSKFTVAFKKTLSAYHISNKPRMKDKVQAQQMLYDLIENSLADVEILLDQMFLLSKLLMYEYQSNLEKSVLNEFVNLNLRIEKLVSRIRSIQKKLELELFNAQLSGLNGNYELAMQTIDQVIKSANEKSLGLIVNKAEKLKQELQEKFKNWYQIVNQNTKVKKALEEVNISNYITKLKQKMNSIN